MTRLLLQLILALSFATSLCYAAPPAKQTVAPTLAAEPVLLDNQPVFTIASAPWPSPPRNGPGPSPNDWIKSAVTGCCRRP